LVIFQLHQNIIAFPCIARSASTNAAFHFDFQLKEMVLRRHFRSGAHNASSDHKELSARFARKNRTLLRALDREFRPDSAG
jgi:hypothetical protein